MASLEFEGFQMFFAIAALFAIVILSSIMASQAQTQFEKAQDVALKLVVPNTVFILLIGFGGVYLLKDMNDDRQLFFVFAPLLLSAIWIAVLQIIHSFLRQRFVAN
jgi:hypothetical protein